MTPREPREPGSESDAGRWDRVCRRLRAEVGEDVYSSWFTRMELELGCVRGRAPVGADAFSQELDSVALRRAPARAVARGDRRSIKKDRPLVMPLGHHRQREPRGEARSSAGARPLGRGPSAAARAAQANLQRGEGPAGSPLDPRLTFASFLVGRSNALAHAAARQVAEASRFSAAALQPALYSCRRRARQDAPAAGDRLERREPRPPRAST